MPERTVMYRPSRVEQGLASASSSPAPTSSAKVLSRQEFDLIVVGLYNQSRAALTEAATQALLHQRALGYLRTVENAPGIDGQKVAEFARRVLQLQEALDQLEWTRLVLGKKPDVGPPATPMLSGIKTFVLGILQVGLEIVAAMVPLLGKLKIRAVELEAALQGTSGDEAAGAVIQRYSSPKLMVAAANASMADFRAAWDFFLQAGTRVEKEAARLGIRP